MTFAGYYAASLEWVDAQTWPQELASSTGLAVLGDARRWYFALAFTAVLETVFWLFVGFFLSCDHFGMFQHRRIAPNTKSYPSWPLIRECLADTVLGHFVIRPLLLFAAFPLFNRLCPLATEQLPGGLTVLWQILVCMQVDDFLFYWSHRALHHRSVYKYIHKKHHTFKHSMALAVEYAHPVEDLVSNTLSTIAGPLLLGSHATVLWLYTALKLWQSIDAHSGYDMPLPISPWSVIRWMDCAPAHDYHHSHNVGNYGGYFVFWDWLMGTDVDYTKFQASPKYHKNRQALGGTAA